MIESSMYGVIGFLLGALVGLVFILPVHNRAVRLTARRLLAALPLSLAETGAEKDLMRAEFAMSVRRLESKIEQLKDRSVGHLVELGKKDEEINRQKAEIVALLIKVAALKGRLTNEILFLPNDEPKNEVVNTPKISVQATPSAKSATHPQYDSAWKHNTAPLAGATSTSSGASVEGNHNFTRARGSLSVAK